MLIYYSLKNPWKVLEICLSEVVRTMLTKKWQKVMDRNPVRSWFCQRFFAWYSETILCHKNLREFYPVKCYWVARKFVDKFKCWFKMFPFCCCSGYFIEQGTLFQRKKKNPRNLSNKFKCSRIAWLLKCKKSLSEIR